MFASLFDTDGELIAPNPIPEQEGEVEVPELQQRILLDPQQQNIAPPAAPAIIELPADQANQDEVPAQEIVQPAPEPILVRRNPMRDRRPPERHRLYVRSDRFAFAVESSEELNDKISFKDAFLHKGWKAAMQEE